jgi:HEAT repeat protein
MALPTWCAERETWWQSREQWFPVVDFHPTSEFGELVAQLATPHRAQRAYWHLVLSGPSALPAVRRGLTDTNADVRYHCVQALDHLVDEDSSPQLIGMLGDDDWRVRLGALHALACDRCKENTCRPASNAVLPPAIALLRTDPAKHVRAMAAEVVGRWVHTDASAEAALVAARDADGDPAVRKKAGWYAPGGPIHGRTRPKAARRAAAQ